MALGFAAQGKVEERGGGVDKQDSHIGEVNQ